MKIVFALLYLVFSVYASFSSTETSSLSFDDSEMSDEISFNADDENAARYLRSLKSAPVPESGINLVLPSSWEECYAAWEYRFQYMPILTRLRLSPRSRKVYTSCYKIHLAVSKVGEEKFRRFYGNFKVQEIIEDLIQ